jgi:acyl-coenzyme A synthetase/AMP-(fatty) acid ligase
MIPEFLRRVLDEGGDRPAILHGSSTTSYAELNALRRQWSEWLTANAVAAGAVVALRCDYSANAIALFLALIDRSAIVIQAGLAAGPKLEAIVTEGEAEVVIDLRPGRAATCEPTGRSAGHAIYRKLREDGHPGLVLFSSGSTGKIKGAVHDLSRLLKKYARRRHDLRTITFLLFDHIGGIDTLFYCLSNVSAIVVIESREPEAVCAAVEQHRVEVLPVAPTFLNLLYFSRAYQHYDLSSLKYVTYGAEVMSPQTLALCREMFPTANLLQKYGTTEIGTPRSASKSPDSLWMKIGGEGFTWRVVDGILHIRAESAMLGYLNAPNPFTDDGWFITGDCVEVDGEYLRILGRQSDLINVGGRKVYPAEVEAAVKEVPGVVEVTVAAEKNAFLGQIVTATVWKAPGADEADLRVRIKQHTAGRLDAYKVPARITFASGTDYATDRFKKLRTNA